MSYLDDLAKEIEEGLEIPEGITLGSLDVKALYPSLVIDDFARICRERIASSDLKFCGVDMRAATHYIALTHTQEEINELGIEELIPRRRYSRGPRPQISRIEDDPKGHRWVWSSDPEKMTESKKMMIMGVVT